VSRLLTDAGRDHVVLDRGRVAERWRTERWDSLHLISPSWLIRLPGSDWTGPAPDSYLSSARFVRHLEGYARSFSAPVVGDTTVLSVEPAYEVRGCRYRVVTQRGTWCADNVVVATGAFARPHVPAGLGGVLPVVPSTRYRNPGSLPPGGVLVVGASASGVQIADELNRAGREVSIAVGRHTRMPRRYRGMDVYYWLECTGRLAQTIDTVGDPVAARHEPSAQLVAHGELDRSVATLDLGTLHAAGVRLLGRFESLEGPVARFRTDLEHTLAASDAAMNRFLDAVDEHVERSRVDHHVWRDDRPPVLTAPASAARLDLRHEGITSIVLATGLRPDLSFLQVPVVGADGTVVQRRGATSAPGVYVVGQRFQHRRDSASIGGARYDAADVVAHLQAARGRTLQPAGEGWAS
jgi:putative flavoprotein involved in K+ transport